MDARLLLVRHTLSATPVHTLIALSMDAGTLKKADRIRHGFLWCDSNNANGGQCCVNWQRVCRPLELGGLGIHDLHRMGVVLRTRWLWLQRTDPSRPWQHLPFNHTEEVRDIFRACTTRQVGDGISCRFWENHWFLGRSIAEIAPAVHAMVPKRRRKRRRVAEGLQGRSWVQDIHGTLGIEATVQYVELWESLHQFQLSTEPDRLSWKMSANGSYSAASCYSAMLLGSTSIYHWKLNWKTWAPLRIKIFVWLALQDRCWIADRLLWRGLPHPPRCVFCDQVPETMHHLLVGCPFSRQIWHEVLSWCRTTMPPPTAYEDFIEWWAASHGTATAGQQGGISSMIILTAWLIWKARNACVFDAEQPSIMRVFNSIRAEAKSWAAAGAPGLDTMIPET